MALNNSSCLSVYDCAFSWKLMAAQEINCQINNISVEIIAGKKTFFMAFFYG
jgi:hypothetical protein